MPTISPHPSSSGLRRMPGWLSASPWLVVACSLILAAVVLVFDYRSSRREIDIATRIFMERAASLVHAYEATLQAGRAFLWTDEELQGVLDSLATSPDVTYVAVTDEEGNVLASSDAALLGASLATGEEMRDSALCHEATGHIVEMLHGGKVLRVFQVCQQLDVRQFAERLHRHGHGHNRRMERGTPPPLFLFISYDLQPLQMAQASDARQAMVHWMVLAFLAAVGVLTLFLVKGYQRSRLLVQETSALSFALIDTLPLGIVAVDENGCITTFNPEAERISCMAGKEAMGQPLSSVLPGLWKVLRETGLSGDVGPIPPGEQEARCLFGQRRVPLGLTTASIITEEGRFAGRAWMLRDLGEIRRLQAEVRRQDRLAALGNMAAGVAHEIRNPLGAIKGLARFFREISAPESEEARMADVMTEEVRRLDTVVGDLLELARPDRLSLSPVQPAELLERVHRLLQIDMDKAGITLKLQTEDMPPVMLDADRMTQALLNLCLNAVQAMPNGGILRLAAAMPDADTLLLEVEDSGEGIPRERLRDIFSPYYTTKAQGTGLGLSLVLKIVEAHEGDIQVQSNPDHGSRFSLLLPVVGMPPQQL